MARTLVIVKPDSVENGHIGHVITEFEQAGLRVAAMKMVHLTLEQAKAFYKVHEERSFYPELTKWMASTRVVPIVLEYEGDIITKVRDLMGATNPAEAKKGTIRAKYGTEIQANAVHGSDSHANAEKEIRFFFGDMEIL